MSNRILSLLVLFGVFAGFFLLYIYFFVFYTATITVRSNVPEYSVELFGKSVAKTFTYDCPEEVCVITDISPIEYNVTITKPGYISFFQNVDIKPSSKQEVIITLEKEVTLNKQQPVLTVTDEVMADTPVVSAQDKIAQIRLEKLYDRLFELDSGMQIGLKNTESKLELYYLGNGSEKRIGEFDKNISNISIKDISDTAYIFLALGSDIYLYNSKGGRLSQIDLAPNILYIKPGRVSTELLFITDKGAFVYNLGTKEFSYFYFFRDFVYEEDGYIGVIYKNEEKKRSNYGYEDEKDNLIVRYTPSTQEREVIFRTSLNIDKIEKQGDDIYFESEENRYKLENY